MLHISPKKHPQVYDDKKILIKVNCQLSNILLTKQRAFSYQTEKFLCLILTHSLLKKKSKLQSKYKFLEDAPLDFETVQSDIDEEYEII